MLCKRRKPKRPRDEAHERAKHAAVYEIQEKNDVTVAPSERILDLKRIADRYGLMQKTLRNTFRATGVALAPPPAFTCAAYYCKPYASKRDEEARCYAADCQRASKIRISHIKRREMINNMQTLLDTVASKADELAGTVGASHATEAENTIKACRKASGLAISAWLNTPENLDRLDERLTEQLDRAREIVRDLDVFLAHYYQRLATCFQLQQPQHESEAEDEDEDEDEESGSDDASDAADTDYDEQEETDEEDDEQTDETEEDEAGSALPEEGYPLQLEEAGPEGHPLLEESPVSMTSSPMLGCQPPTITGVKRRLWTTAASTEQAPEPSPLEDAAQEAGLEWEGGDLPPTCKQARRQEPALEDWSAPHPHPHQHHQHQHPQVLRSSPAAKAQLHQLVQRSFLLDNALTLDPTAPELEFDSNFEGGKEEDEAEAAGLGVELGVELEEDALEWFGFDSDFSPAKDQACIAKIGSVLSQPL